MIAVILAAGASYRMRPLTNDLPKCLLTVGKKPILGQILENLAQSGLRDILVVTGYHEDMVKDFICKNHHGMSFKFVTNERYAHTGDSVSVWATKPHVQGQDILLVDSDLWFYPGVVTKLLQGEEADLVAINSKVPLDEEAVKVVLDGCCRITEMGKPVEIKKAIGEAIGIRKFSAGFMTQLYEALDRRIVKEGILDQIFEVSVQELLDKGVPLYAIDTCEWPSMELDTPEDYAKAQSLIFAAN